MDMEIIYRKIRDLRRAWGSPEVDQLATEIADILDELAIKVSNIETDFARVGRAFPRED